MQLEKDQWDWSQSLESANYRAPGCAYCHSPRYVTLLFENGERMLNIGRMKVREAAEILEQAGNEYSQNDLAAANKQFAKMRSLHLRNVYLGVGHQSPDYQWWARPTRSGW